MYNGDTLTNDIYTNGTSRWMNIEVQAKSNTIMDVLVYDIESFSLSPAAVFHFLTISTFTNGTIKLHSTTSPLGVYFGELRAYTLDLTN